MRRKWHRPRRRRHPHRLSLLHPRRRHHQHRRPLRHQRRRHRSALTEDEVFARKTVEQVNAEMPLGDVMFDYDASTIRDDQRAALQRNADYLRRWTSVRVSVEGHADARGTNEYNLALGERRANAVKEYLVGLGVMGDRMVVVSKGEETPVCTDEVEACYMRNRRGHFMITAK